MDSKFAKQLLTETKNFLAKLPNLNDVISYGQKLKKIQILPYDLSYLDIYISEDIIVDKGACALLRNEDTIRGSNYSGRIYKSVSTA